MTRSTEPSRTSDLYTTVTRTLLGHLEEGRRPWSPCWNKGPLRLPLRHTGAEYRGVNVLMLWSASMTRGYCSPVWMTFRQALEHGGHVRKGEKGTPVVYWGRLEDKNSSSEGEESPGVKRGFMKSYAVFNADQIDGLPESFRTLGREEIRFINPDQRDQEAEQFFARTGARLLTGGQRAAYAVGADQILMPSFEDFRSSEDYYSVLFHELVHWTGHESRLDRFGKTSGSSRKRKDYAMEELVAELGAAFLCASLGLSCEPREDHAAYIGSWLDALGQDTRFVFSAASCASRAVDYLKARVSP